MMEPEAQKLSYVLIWDSFLWLFMHSDNINISSSAWEKIVFLEADGVCELWDSGKMLFWFVATVSMFTYAKVACILKVPYYE